MKKILLITTVVASLSGLTALGQGNFIFGTGGSTVWNPATQTRGGAFNVAFLYDLTLGQTPLIASTTGIAFTPTNSVANLGANNPWTSLLNDPNYHLAINNTTAAAAVGTLTAAGGVTYLAGGNFLVSGTSSSGGTASVFVIGWDNTYATPALAAAAGASVGWSIPINYTYAANPGAASGNFTTAAQAATVSIAFGVAPVPEPATFALAGLGIAAMLVARRRK